MDVEHILERMVLVGKPVRKLVRMVLVGMQAHKLACMVPVEGTQVYMVEGMLAVRKQAGMVAHLRVRRHSIDCCRNILPIGAPSCTKKATRYKPLVVFSFKDSF